MERYILFLICAVLLFPHLAEAQEEADSAWYLDKPIADILFEGLEAVRRRELQPIIGPYIGTNFTEAEFLELQSRLYALNFFSEVIANAEPFSEAREKVVIIFSVVEYPTISKIEITGNDDFTRLDILRDISLRKASFVSLLAMREDAAVVEAMYKERGFINTNVDVTFDEETSILHIDIIEGLQQRVREIVFVGNKIFPEKKLKRAIDTKSVSLFRKGYFLESNLNTDIDLVQEFYYERGYIDAEVLNIEREVISEDRKQRSMKLTFYINEGEQYVFGGVTFEGNVTFSDEELSKFITHKIDAVIDMPKLQTQLRNVSEQYYENGYIFNEITPVDQRVGNKVMVTLKIVEASRAHIENIVVQGNTKTKDFVINREIDLKIGEVYNNRKLREAYFRLANLRLFDVIDVQPVPGSSEGLMDVVFALEEGRTMDISAGLGLALGGTSSTLPVSINLRWSERNFLGLGFELTSGLSLSMGSQRFDISVFSDWFFGKRVFAGASMYVWHDTIDFVRQDIVPPQYNNGVPDVFTGEYVFTEDTTYNGSQYSAGEYFPGHPTPEQISGNDLEQDYEYASQVGLLYNQNQNLMQYDSIRVGLGLQTGYRYITPVGSLVPRTSVNFGIDYITYDPLLYRPNNAQTRANLNTIVNVNSIAFSLAWDMRDIRFNPSRGMYASQGFILTGGILFGERHFIRSNSRLDFYIPLVDIPVIEGWSWKMVLGMQTTFSMLLPYFDPSSDNYTFATSGPSDSDKLMLDGIFYGRGWPVERDGEALWNSWIELRMELARDIIWLDFFFEAARLWGDHTDLALQSIETMKFTMGGGFRFVINQFPLRFYFGKRFRIKENGEAIWQTGNIGSGGNPGSGIDFIFSMTYEFF